MLILRRRFSYNTKQLTLRSHYFLWARFWTHRIPKRCHLFRNLRASVVGAGVGEGVTGGGGDVGLSVVVTLGAVKMERS